MKKYTHYILAVIAFFGFTFVAEAQWTAPTATPPNNNVAAPLNTGSTPQIKSGSLGVTGLANYGVSNLFGKLTVGCVGGGCPLSAGGPVPILFEVSGQGTSWFNNRVDMRNNLIFDTNGSRIGVGLSYPNSQVHVHSSNSRAGVTISTGTTNWINLYQPYNQGELRIAHGAGSNLTDLVTFKVDGSVGIGTTNPSKSLEVNGAALIKTDNQAIRGTNSHGVVYLGDTNHYIRSVVGGGVRLGTYNAGDSINIQENTGYVGIGQGRTNPSAQLDVAGNANVTGTLTAPNINSSGTINANNANVTGTLVVTGIRTVYSNGTGTSPRLVREKRCGNLGDVLYLDNSQKSGACSDRGAIGYLIPF